MWSIMLPDGALIKKRWQQQSGLTNHVVTCTWVNGYKRKGFCYPEGCLAVEYIKEIENEPDKQVEVLTFRFKEDLVDYTNAALVRVENNYKKRQIAEAEREVQRAKANLERVKKEMEEN